MTETGRRVPIFLTLTLTFSSIFWGLAIYTGNSAGGRGAYAVGLMWCPGISALLTCKICGINLSELGWSWGHWRYQRLAYLLPLGYAGVAYGIVWFSGLGGVPNPQFINATRSSLDWTGAPGWLVAGGWFVLMATTGVVRSVANSLGEEIGWRGFLAPQLSEKWGLTAGALITGAIWTLWHFPVIFFADYNSTTPRWFAASCFTVMVMSLSFIMNWLRLKSGSLWTAAILHASHNTFIQGFFTPITASHGPKTAYAIDEFGFVLPLVILAVAIGFWRNRIDVAQAT